MSPLAVTLLVVTIVGVGAVSLLTVANRRDPEAPGRPWWQRSSVWIGVSIVFVLLGVFVAPRLLGFTFVFLPFLWVGGGRRRRQPTNGDGQR